MQCSSESEMIEVGGAANGGCVTYVSVDMVMINGCSVNGRSFGLLMINNLSGLPES